MYTKLSKLKYIISCMNRCCEFFFLHKCKNISQKSNMNVQIHTWSFIQNEKSLIMESEFKFSNKFNAPFKPS